MLGKIFVFIIGTAIGVAVTYYHRWFVRTVGTSSWAERTLGGGGTYLMWQLIGVLIVVFTVLYTIGGFEKIVGWIGGFFGYSAS